MYNNNPLLIPNIFFLLKKLVLMLLKYKWKKNIKLKNSLDLNKNNIFNKYVNNKYKLVPFNSINNDTGESRYFPSDFKEWTNSIYYFNSNYIKNLPVYDIKINKLLKNYFDLYLDRKNTKSWIILPKKRNLSLNKIFISKAELKHTSSKVIITLYVFNRERIVLLNKLKNFNKSLLKIRNFFYLYINIYKDFYNKYFKTVLYKELIFIKRTKLKFDLNNLKFKDILLYKLSKLLSKFYKKKVEFNIINLRSFKYNSNIVTEILRKKLVHRSANILKIMNFILKKSIKSKKNIIVNKRRLMKEINLNIIENKYKNLNINTIVKNVNLNETIKDLYKIENQNIIFDSIKYKNIEGIKLEVKGRLTKRYRADRSIFKLRIKGTLRNTDSAYQGLSSVNYRGNTNSNLEYSMDVSKRRIGAFAVKGWISGKSYSTYSKPLTSESVHIDPRAITGFTDAEGSFMITISKDSKRGTEWSVRPRFRISLHNKDISILRNIREYLGVGIVTSDKDARIRFESLNDLDIVIDHFEKYSLISQKYADYILFKKAYSLIKNKDHLTKEGLNKILAIRASINLGLSDDLKEAFPNIIPVERPLVVNKGILDPNWIIGFTSGEGSFYIRIAKNSTLKTGYQVQLVFQIAQHVRDRALMGSLISFF
uniref:Ribosomal protein 3/homing endonuclease-like fusion protein n=1 Tax=Ophiostoma megalobrunneum TaxID=666551 RepID=C7SWG0_9PEZI|nr:ribosomal protein 3/homing endonuclease-like fusion protein [Ophiostoma megalobrunneum]